jgi:hypothetical protein
MLLLTAVEDSKSRVDQVRSERAQAQGLLQIDEGRGSDYIVDENAEKPLGDLVRSIILDYTEPDDESDDESNESAFETLYEPLGRLLTSLPNLARFKCNDSSRCIDYITNFGFTKLTHISIPYLNDPEQLSLLSNFPLLKELELQDYVYTTFYDTNRFDVIPPTWEYALKPLSLERLSYQLAPSRGHVPLSLNFLRSITVSIVQINTGPYDIIECINALLSSVTSLTITSESNGYNSVKLDPLIFTRFSQLQYCRLESQNHAIELPYDFFTLLLATTTITSLSIAISHRYGHTIYNLFNALRSTSAPSHLKRIHLDWVADETAHDLYEAQEDLTRLIIRTRDLGIKLYGRAVDAHLDLSKSGKLIRDDPEYHEDHWAPLVKELSHESLISYMKCYFLFQETHPKVGSGCATRIQEL